MYCPLLSEGIINEHFLILCAMVLNSVLNFPFQLFRGNINRFGIVFHRINRPFVASHVRFYPRSWYSWISMRVEIYGCPTGTGFII